ncbi:MAG: transposase, partial [Peptostreptococcaceae bacterium]|nr:transposase [Peptostreptococcaceae bacterium]MBK5262719.1 transposase [Peptostreptococcaceae bacterium]
GTIEGLNNYIKVIKRVAFGYKSFFHFRNRILIFRNLIKPMSKCQAS